MKDDLESTEGFCASLTFAKLKYQEIHFILKITAVKTATVKY